MGKEAIPVPKRDEADLRAMDPTGTSLQTTHFTNCNSSIRAAMAMMSSGYPPPLSRKCSRVERPRALTVKRCGARHIDAVLVTELSRWGRSTLDLLETLREPEARRVSVVSLSGMTFDLASATGRRWPQCWPVLPSSNGIFFGSGCDRISPLRGRKVRCSEGGLASVRNPIAWPQGPRSGRRRPELSAIGRELGLSKNTVADIVGRAPSPFAALRDRASHPTRFP
jgi:putative DNA-invertase from lambdoid prophage Rac